MIRNGRTIRYVKKDNLGKVTQGMSFVQAKTPQKRITASPIAPVSPKKQKIGFAEKLTNFLENDSILD